MKNFIFIFILLSSFLNADKNLPAKQRAEVLIISTTMGKNRQERKAKLLSEQLKPYNISSEIIFDIKKENAKDILSKRRLIIVDALDGKGGVARLLRQYEDIIEDLKIPYIALKLNYEKYGNMEDNFAKKLLAYFGEAGKYNYAQGAALLAKKYFGFNTNPQPVHKLGKTGIYHPTKGKGTFKNLDEYLKTLSEKERSQPKIAIALHQQNIASDDTAIVDYAIDKLNKAGITPIAFYTEVGEDDFAGKRFFIKDGKVLVDLVLSFQVMIMDQEKLKKDYTDIGLKVMHGMVYRQGEKTEWEKDKQGISMNWIPMSYVIPEHIGYTDQMIIAALDKESKKTTPIEYQLDMFMKIAINNSKLKQKHNKDKNIAIFYYNYPPGVNNFGASYMKYPESIENILDNMQKAGYKTQSKKADFFIKELPKSMAYYYQNTLYDEKYADLLPYSEYMKWFYKLPLEIQKQINKAWGKPQNNQFVIHKNSKKYFIIPRYKLGNVTLLPQPSRSNYNDKNNEAALYHDTSKPVPHHYLAVYLYVKKQNDAVVHLGTHGTYEWTYGKERGLSIYDSPLLSVGEIPNIYPYITNNLAEGIQAKRRGRATLISHQTPPFGASGTYKELSDIMDLINQYQQSTDAVKEKTKTKLIDLVIKMNLHKDMKYTKEKMQTQTEVFVADLYDYLNGLSTTLTPLGMHKYGSYPNDDHMVQTLMSMLGDAYIKATQGEKGLSGINYKDLNKTNAYQTIQKFVIEKESKENLDSSLLPFIETAKVYRDNFINNQEIKSLLKGLNAQYIPTSVGGDPVRSPESVPTGKNMYGFDPDRIPTEAAYDTGKKIMKEYIQNYYATHGKYPDKISFNLWSLETMRHFGVLESQILYAMGIKPIWSKGGISDEMVQSMAKGILAGFLSEDFATWLSKFVTVERIKTFDFLMPESMKKKFYMALKMGRGKISGVEIIPYGDLKRPRVDVVVQATGLYRDTFPNVMKLIQDGVEKISTLKEEHNYVREHTLSLEKMLLEKGYSDKDAKYLSTARMFSAKSGEYGNGVSDTAMATETWEEENKIATNYLRKSGYIYGSDTSRWGEKLEDTDLFAQNLKGSDAVMFSRTSNLYGMMTSDDPYGYFGSMALAIRSIDGNSPQMLISNLRDPNNAKMQNVSEFISNELRTRYYNPKWIEEMQKSGYSGANQVLDVVNNFWGWQVVYPDGVRSDQWQEFVDIYYDDKYDMKMDEWFEKTNPTVRAQMAEVMLEAIRKGYFQTDAKTIKKLVETLEDISKRFNHKSENKKLNEFIKAQKSVGYGLSIPVAKPVAKAKANANKPVVKAKPKIKGQKLEEVKKEQKEKTDYSEILLYSFLAFLILIGIFYEMRNNFKTRHLK
ncbi:cobaltochelatase subunit CobN [Sulfurimonas lithotrophica]|uniref:Cobaltochelatase subunit CobN n=1 Tax=Sulfurimonas lithotrophica TaxID=2590022 RepID=A0A5P8P2V7_9BACT|nr:cobaltochelatase subunit CobN [Sulfurimonas lithotrophica]QFR49986.1 cobaltochelatase subunit CobN [Sulfurimonas lithotrophica]